VSREPIIRPLTWPLLPTPDANGALDFPSLDDSVRQMIHVILLTRPGEQLMRPEFGAGISRFLDEPNTIETRRRLRDVVGTALATWEQRISIDEIDVTPVDGAPTTVRIDIAYRLKRTGQSKQTSLTMVLGG
jgi:phage baseplate assembly protein W